MAFDFIQSRISHLDSYLKGLDAKFAARFDSAQNTTAPQFNDVFNHALNKTEETKKVTAKISDDYSKLPANFEQYIDSVTDNAAGRYQVELSSNLIKSVIKQESGFNPDAVSHAGAEGLMQLMPATAKSLGVFNSNNPYQNLKGGVEYLAKMMDRFGGDVQKALAAYNAGPEAVEKYKGIPPYRETQNYVESIMQDYLKREGYQSVDMIV